MNRNKGATHEYISIYKFTNGVPMECQVTPLVPMDDQNPIVLNPIHWENRLSPRNEMHLTNGVPIEC